MTDDGRRERLPVLPPRPGPDGGGGWPGGRPRVEIRTASVRFPGIVGLLLAIPAFFLFGFLAILALIAGAIGMLIGPWLLRRMLRRMEADLPVGDATIELDRTAYAERERSDGGSARDVTIEVEASPQEREAINRSSSSRKRGSTSA